MSLRWALLVAAASGACASSPAEAPRSELGFLDPARCAAPAPDAVAGALYLCDCAEGADPACTPGDDAQAGTSARTAQRSLAGAQAALNAGPAGTQVLLCRGGAWSSPGGERYRLSPSCTPDAPCVLADYGDPARPAPKLVAGAGQVHGLTLDPGNDDAVRAGYVVRNLHITKHVDRGQGIGVLTYRAVQDVLLSCLEVDGYGVGVQVNPAGQPSLRIRLEDSLIHHNGGQGWLGGCTGCVVANNRFHDNGTTALHHNIYNSAVGAAPSAVVGMIVRGNHSSHSAVDPASGKCVGTHVIAHGGTFEDLLIEGNLLEEPIGGADQGCWGITVDGASGGADASYRAIVRGNTVRDVGNLSIGLSSCVDCVIENNLVVQRSVGGHGIRVPDRKTQPPDLDLDRATVRNNTVWFSGPGGGTGIAVGERGQGHVVASNIVAYAAEAPRLACYAFDLAPGAYARVDANLGHNCGTYEQGAAGMDARALEADPRFVSPPDDFRLAPDSPARDTGSPEAAPPSDIAGRARDGAPDRGAHEGD